MKIIEKEFNAITGEEIITERDETKQETAIRLSDQAAAEEAAEKAAKTAEKRAALLARLGITEDEAKLLIG